MKTTISILAILMTFILMSSFTGKNTNEFIGTYGVPDSDPSSIKLTINPDHTFYYQDLSIPGKKIAVNGNWALKGKKLFLTNAGSAKNFHHVWTFTENGQVARSRKGLTFYRLCKIG